jgi:hypothetical protein
MRKDSKEDYMRSREDYLRMEQKLEAWRDETKSFLQSIQQEMKDFHGRLCSIEEKYRQGK